MKFFMDFVNFSAKSVFSSSGITNGADRSKGFKNKAKSRGKSSQNPLFGPKVTFTQKVTFGRQSRKSAKMTFEPKSDISAPGDRKTSKKPLPTGTSESLGAKSHFWYPKTAKRYFWAHFGSRSLKSGNFALLRAPPYF